LRAMKTIGCFITGTDTGVGKTLVTAGLAAALMERHGKRVHLWKPVQTGVRPGDADADSARLQRGSGSPQPAETIATYTLDEPLAPWMAAERAGVKLRFDRLLDEGRRRMAEADILLAEGAGGLLVPITDRETMLDLAAAIGLPLIVVARAGLGTVNHTLLTVSQARHRCVPVAGVILNGYERGAEREVRENARMIEHFGRVRVLGMLPRMPVSPGTDDFCRDDREKFCPDRTDAGDASDRMPGDPDWREWRKVVAERVEYDSIFL